MSDDRSSEVPVDARRFGHDYPVSLRQTLALMERETRQADAGSKHALPTGFEPLDQILSGGLRPGELLILGGGFGVGKTIMGLQMARNVVCHAPRHRALYVCYEHDPLHLLSRLICMESAACGLGREALSLRRLETLSHEPADLKGVLSRLRQSPLYRPVIEAIEAYQERLLLIRASGDTATLDRIREWVQGAQTQETHQLLLVIDYLQKIPTTQQRLTAEELSTTFVTQGLKELAMAEGIQVVAIAAVSRAGLQAKRMRLFDLRGGSALQYEADVGLMLHNKHDIVSREHLIYDPQHAEAMRNWVVLSVEKNRAGRHATDLEFPLDASHFRIVPDGRFVRERLIDARVVMS